MKNMPMFYFVLKAFILGTASSHKLCFGAKKYEKIVYSCTPQFYYVKMGLRGHTLHGHVSLLGGSDHTCFLVHESEMLTFVFAKK